ncbi:MAG TPA: hypothetical protein VK789_02500 [Bryobacteraceae bacterium]|jgi:hypothetical protein|nr:hypothetical protein [Bryobacteraceae bacterium]
MENNVKQTRDPKQEESLSEAELDQIVGGGANAINTSRSNIKDN